MCSEAQQRDGGPKARPRRSRSAAMLATRWSPQRAGSVIAQCYQRRPPHCSTKRPASSRITQPRDLQPARGEAWTRQSRRGRAHVQARHRPTPQRITDAGRRGGATDAIESESASLCAQYLQRRTRAQHVLCERARQQEDSIDFARPTPARTPRSRVDALYSEGAVYSGKDGCRPAQNGHSRRGSRSC